MRNLVNKYNISQSDLMRLALQCFERCDKYYFMPDFGVSIVRFKRFLSRKVCK